MPARRRGQEARRAQRRADRQPAGPVYDEVEAGWAEHQDYEQVRRAHQADPLAQEAERARRASAAQRAWSQILQARDQVEADFARWARGDYS